MSSFPTRRQWLVVIRVNILISSITTILVVRVMTRPAEVPDVTRDRAAPAASSTVAPELTPRAQLPPVVVAVAATVAPTAAATPTRPAPTPTSPPPVVAEKISLAISNVNYPGQRQRESVVIANEGDAVELKGWTLASQRGTAYTFPNVTLFRDTFINIYTTSGADVSTDLFMNRGDAAWQVGDVVTLARNGQPVATYAIKP